MTQRVLSELPIPEPVPDSPTWVQAQAIAHRVAVRNGGNATGDAADIEIESLVAGLYGLDTSDLSWVSHVLADAQALEGVATFASHPWNPSFRAS